jgi:hypothetical protein
VPFAVFICGKLRINCALVLALFGLKDRPAQDTQKWLSKCYFRHREPRFLWGGARFGAEVAASDF